MPSKKESNLTISLHIAARSVIIHFCTFYTVAHDALWSSNNYVSLNAATSDQPVVASKDIDQRSLTIRRIQRYRPTITDHSSHQRSWLVCS